MENSTKLILSAVFAAYLAVSGCQPPAAQPETLVQTPALLSSGSAEPAPTQTSAPEPTEVHGKLILSDDFGVGSPLCQVEPDSSSFASVCLENELAVSQTKGRRKVDILLAREVPVQTGTFSFEVETLSAAAEKVRSDQNNYGLYFIDESSQYHVLRLAAQYFDFEVWPMNTKGKIEVKTNPAFSLSIKPAGQSNILRLDCSVSGCDFFANGSLAGRSPVGITGEVKAVGLFASSAWNQQFGQISYKNLRIYSLPDEQFNTQPYLFEDPLTSGSEFFTGTGLSGTFNRYDSDGFHFSPVVPYGYYGVKGGPALGDMTVGVTVKMEVAPGVSGSRYAGLVCRSSQEGMIMAVIRTDGSYSIYRDTPRRPFAVLAQKASDTILPGTVENKLRLDCIGNQINFYINNAKVESLTDSRFGLRFGRAGLFTKAGGTPGPDAVVFSDLIIAEIR